ncbi:uncharacterized protein [Dermacentor albipictus]|uniref:uncharacterized protein isoform X2 n=1 Tax=Dermacentor albipictus TaxID=60249 RepID=UPI0031FD1847
MPHTRKSKPASPSRSPPRPPAAEGSPPSRDSEFSADGDALVARFSALVDQLAVTEEESRPPAAEGEEDDAQSSASGVTAVAAARPADPASGAARRCQDVYDEVLAFCSAPGNKLSSRRHGRLAWEMPLRGDCCHTCCTDNGSKRG